MCNRGNVRYARNELEKALDDYDAALRLSPGLADARVGRGAVQLAKGEWDAAISEYAKALQIDRFSVPALIGRAAAHRARRDKGDFDESIADYDQAIRQSPNRASSYYARADTWLLKGQPDKALIDYKRGMISSGAGRSANVPTEKYPESTEGANTAENVARACPEMALSGDLAGRRRRM